MTFIENIGNIQYDNTEEGTIRIEDNFSCAELNVVYRETYTTRVQRQPCDSVIMNVDKNNTVENVQFMLDGQRVAIVDASTDMTDISFIKMHKEDDTVVIEIEIV